MYVSWSHLGYQSRDCHDFGFKTHSTQGAACPPDLGIKQQAGASYPRLSSIRLGSRSPRWKGGWSPHGQRKGGLFQRVQGRSLLHPWFWNRKCWVSVGQPITSDLPLRGRGGGRAGWLPLPPGQIQAACQTQNWLHKFVSWNQSSQVITQKY